MTYYSPFQLKCWKKWILDSGWAQIGTEDLEPKAATLACNVHGGM